MDPVKEYRESIRPYPIATMVRGILGWSYTLIFIVLYIFPPAPLENAIESFDQSNLWCTSIVLFLALMGVTEFFKRSWQLVYQIFEVRHPPLALVNVAALACLPAMVLVKYYMLEGRQMTSDFDGVLLGAVMLVYLIANYLDVRKRIRTRLIHLNQSMPVVLSPTRGWRSTALFLVIGFALGLLATRAPNLPTVIVYSMHILGALGILTLVHLVLHSLAKLRFPSLKV